MNSSIDNFFDRPESIVAEIALNATMAGATRLEFNLNGNFLDIYDDRPGCEEMDICPEGFLRLMGVSEQLAFLDRRGSVHIDSTRFFTDEEYRAHAYTRLQTPKTIEGFRVFAVLRPDGAGSGRTIDTADALSLFPLDIYWSGKRVKRMHVEDLCGEHEIKTEYMGNDVYIRPSLVLSQQVSEKSLKELSLVWHGLSIGMHGLESAERSHRGPSGQAVDSESGLDGGL